MATAFSDLHPLAFQRVVGAVLKHDGYKLLNAEYTVRSSSTVAYSPKPSPHANTVSSEPPVVVELLSLPRESDTNVKPVVVMCRGKSFVVDSKKDVKDLDDFIVLKR